MNIEIDDNFTGQPDPESACSLNSDSDSDDYSFEHSAPSLSKCEATINDNSNYNHDKEDWLKKIFKLIVPAFIVWFLHGLLPLYAVFLSYAAFYPTCAVLIDLISDANNIKKLTKLEIASFLKIASLGLTALVAIVSLLAFYVPSFAFLVAYLPASIIVLAGFQLVVAVTTYPLKQSQNRISVLSIHEQFLIYTVVTMTTVMFGVGLLVEANFVLAASLIATVGLCSVVIDKPIIEFLKDKNDSNNIEPLKDKNDSNNIEPLEYKKDSTNIELATSLVTYFFNIFLNPIFTIALTLIFGLSGFGLLPALALTDSVFASIWFGCIFVYSFGTYIYALTIIKEEEKDITLMVVMVRFYNECFAKNKIKTLHFLANITFGLFLVYIIISLIVNPAVGFVAALSLGLSSPVVWATIISMSLLLVILMYGFMEEKPEDAVDLLNAAIWFALSYSVASYIMAPAGTLFVAMLGVNVEIALPLAFVVCVAALKLLKTYFDKTGYITLKFFNTTKPYYKAIIVLLSLLTLIVGIVLAFSGMFEIFAATNVMQAFMQALTVATSVIVAATVWRTLDKALYNTDNTESLFKIKIDSLGKIALKVLGVILFAGVGYFVAAILPMFAGLVLPTWSALASAFSAVSVPGVFVATFTAAYATNIASFYVPTNPLLLIKPSQEKSFNNGFLDTRFRSGEFLKDCDLTNFVDSLCEQKEDHLITFEKVNNTLSVKIKDGGYIANINIEPDENINIKFILPPDSSREEQHISVADLRYSEETANNCVDYLTSLMQAVRTNSQ